jgi:hypothetical protein
MKAARVVSIASAILGFATAVYLAHAWFFGDVAEPSHPPLTSVIDMISLVFSYMVSGVIVLAKIAAILTQAPCLVGIPLAETLPGLDHRPPSRESRDRWALWFVWFAAAVLCHCIGIGVVLSLG